MSNFSTFTNASSPSSPKKVPLTRADGTTVLLTISQLRDEVLAGKTYKPQAESIKEKEQQVKDAHAQKVQFIKDQTAGANHLREVSLRASMIRESTDKLFLRLAEHYGVMFDIQRAGFILGEMVGCPIVQHLSAPERANPGHLTDAALLTRAAKEVRTLMLRTIDILQMTRQAQRSATENIEILQSALNETYVSEGDLRTLAAGDMDEHLRVLASTCLGEDAVESAIPVLNSAL